MTSPDMFGLVNRFSCITRLNIHHQLENHHEELFSTELHWEVFCCIITISKKRLGHVTSPESKMAERDVSTDFVFLSISTWPEFNFTHAENRKQ